AQGPATTPVLRFMLFAFKLSNLLCASIFSDLHFGMARLVAPAPEVVAEKGLDRSLGALLTWAGVEEEESVANLARAFGFPAEAVVLANIHPRIFAAASEAMVTTILDGMEGSFFTKAAIKVAHDTAITSCTVQREPPQPPATLAAVLAIKTSHVADSIDETEVPSPDPSDIEQWFRNCESIKRGPPLQDKEPTPDQIAVMHARVVVLKMEHYADFSVLTPNGRQMAKRLRHRSWVLQEDGTYQPFDAPGQGSLTAWESCYAVWEVIMFMLRFPPAAPGGDPQEVLTPIASETYLEAFRELCKEHPECWHLCQLAVDRCRAEHLPRVARQMRERLGRQVTWSEALIACARDDGYWDRHVRRPAIGYLARGLKRKADEVEDGAGQAGVASQQSRGKRRKVSFYADCGSFAAAEIKRIADKGFVELFTSLEDVVARWSKAVASKVALLTKVRDDGTTKVRLIIDLRRSGGNGFVDLPERVVLPRLSDLVDGIVDLMAVDDQTADVGYEVCVMVFEDAFHMLAIREEDRGAMAVRTLEGWAVFRRLCCGIAAAPLVWCRVGAAAARLGFRPEELRIQVFVDDPAIATRGAPATRAWLTGALLLLWNVLGLKFKWLKARRGQAVPWIGAQVSLEQRARRWGVLDTLALQKVAEMRSSAERLREATGMVNIKAVQQLAGQLSWASGLIRSFNSALWGVIAAHVAEHAAAKFSAKKRPTQLFFIVRVRQAIEWVRLLLAGIVGTPQGNLAVQRLADVASRSAAMRMRVRTDASPFGFGGILFCRDWPAAWISGEWSAEDLALFSAARGGPAWQAEWELCAALPAVDTWLPRLRGQTLCLFQLGATAALRALLRAAGGAPAMNAVAAEIALRLECAGVQVVPEHLAGMFDFECDALSRIGEGAEMPGSLLRPAQCMWAGRLRRDGGAAFVALGPALRAAALKGKGKGKQHGGENGARAPELSEAPLRGEAEVATRGVIFVFAGVWGDCRNWRRGRVLSGSSVDGACARHARWAEVREAARGSAGLAASQTGMQIRSHPGGGFRRDREAVVAGLVEDIGASSSRASTGSLWATWAEFHQAMFGLDLDPLPLTVDQVFAVSACFMEGGYEGFKGYLSRAREMHVLARRAWCAQLDLAFRKSALSALRGAGVARQSAPFDLILALDVVGRGEQQPGPGAPVGWANFLVIATYFVMREIEVAAPRAARVTWNEEGRSISMRLPVSTVDPRAVGCARTWACLCREGRRRPDCPYHAAVRQIDLLKGTFGAPWPPDCPLFPTSCGDACLEVGIVDSLERTLVAANIGVASDAGAELCGGHSFRVTGAQRLSSLGVEISKIMVLARWPSDAVSRYVGEAPLDRLPAEVAALEARRDHLKIAGRMREELRGLSARLESHAAAADGREQALRRELASSLDHLQE
ncbi:unnamed protein product, partial [Prorocentrum cordatum]